MGGYKGRIGIFELITFDDKLRRMISSGENEEALRAQVRASGVPDMRADGLEKVRSGITSINEVLRVTQE